MTIEQEQTKLKLEVGKSYVARNGEVVRIVGLREGNGYYEYWPYEGENNKRYRIDGTYSIGISPSEYDLIAEAPTVDEQATSDIEQQVNRGAAGMAMPPFIIDDEHDSKASLQRLADKRLSTIRSMAAQFGVEKRRNAQAEAKLRKDIELLQGLKARMADELVQTQEALCVAEKSEDFWKDSANLWKGYYYTIKSIHDRRAAEEQTAIKVLMALILIGVAVIAISFAAGWFNG